MLQAFTAWTKANPLKASALLVMLSLIASLRFVPFFGFRPVLSGALCFATLASVVHCWQSGVFMQKARS